MATQTMCDVCEEELVIEPKYATRTDTLTDQIKKIRVQGGGLKDVLITISKEGYGSITQRLDVCRNCLEKLCENGSEVTDA